MIEGLSIELDDIGISADVIGVTMAAFLLPRVDLTPMKAPAQQSIGANVLMAGDAER